MGGPSTIHPTKSGRGLNKNLRNLNGTWILSRHLSTGVPPALTIQGFTSATRQAIVAAPISLVIQQSHYPSQIFVKQITSANISAVPERWWPPQKSGAWSEWCEIKGSVVGDIKTRSRWVRGDQFDYKDGIGFCTEGLASSAEFLEAEVECASQGWRAVQVWFVDPGRLTKRVATLAKDG